MMEFPLELRAALESRAAGYPFVKLQQAAQTLSERYRKESGAGKRLLTTDPEAAAYAAVRMPATFGAIAAALDYALEFTEARPASLLDVGAGTGAGAWAAAALLDLTEVVCLEREGAMSRLGAALMAAGSPALKRARWVERELTAASPLSERAELVVASYVLGEMRAADRQAAAEQLWAATEQLLVVVEPGTPAGYAGLREVRELLLSKGAHIAAPCPRENSCGLSEGDWCHFTCRVARSKLHKLLKGGDAPYEDEKFCYLAVSKEPCGCAEARILRHPYVEPGKITLELCTRSGLERTIVRKKDGSLFKQARKASCGSPFLAPPAGDSSPDPNAKSNSRA